MARVAAEKKPTTPAAEAPPKLTGRRDDKFDLSKLRPNSWNPNAFTDFEMASLRRGFQEDGWLKSHALAIWGTDEKGKTQNIIIDGEHRWEVAKDLGITHGPVVFLDGLTETQARALTAKTLKRGKPEEGLLGALVRSIQHDLPTDNLALSLGIPEASLMKLLAEPEIPIDGGAEPTFSGEGGPGVVKTIIPQADVRMVNLMLTHKTHEEFTAAVKKLAAKHKTASVTDTVLEVVRRAAAGL